MAINKEKLAKLVKFSRDANFAMFQEVQSLLEAVENLNTKLEGVDFKGVDIMNIKGDAGADAITPSDARLIQLIRPLIPEVKDGEDGKTPSKRELKKMMKELIPEPKNGKDADVEGIVEEVLSKVPKVEQIQPDMAEDIRNKIELLEGDERLTIASINGLDDLIDSKVTATRNAILGGRQGQVGYNMFVDGTKKGKAVNTNFVAGTGVTLTHAEANGRNDITIDVAASSSFADSETPSGTVNGVNDTFTLANTPTAGTVRLYVNGMRQNVGAGNDYTISGGTITFESASIPETGDVILADYRY